MARAFGFLVFGSLALAATASSVLADERLELGVRAELGDGSVVEGTLVGRDADALRIEVDGDVRRVAIEAIAHLSVVSPDDPDLRDLPGARAVAILRALEWLSRHQAIDGRWDADGFGQRCEGEACSGAGQASHDVGQTGLALLAFLGAGVTPDSPHLGSTVARAVGFLLESQTEEGRFGPEGERFVYDHAIATLALAEAAVRGLADARPALRRAVGFLVGAQNPGWGWRYRVRPGDNDTSVTSWAARALLRARDAGLEVPDASLEGVEAWLRMVTDVDLGRTGYIERGIAGRPEPGTFARLESCTAMAVIVRVGMGTLGAADPLARRQVARLADQLPAWDRDGGPSRTSLVDFYYWHHGTLAMQVAGGREARRWTLALDGALLKHQRFGGGETGSWDPVGAWGEAGGRVATTSLGALALLAASSDRR